MASADKSKALHALIIGGSMAGLFASVLLRRHNYRVTVFERIGAELQGRGAGIVTHDELFRALTTAGIDCKPADLGVPVEGRRVFARDGSIVLESQIPQILTSWGKLFGLLRKRLPAECYQKRNLVRVEEGDTEVTAHFEDGSKESGDILIGADGIYSTVRSQLLPDSKPEYAGYIAWRGLVDEMDLSESTRVALFDHFSFGLPSGEQFLGYPVAGSSEATGHGRRRYNFVWYRPASRTDLGNWFSVKTSETAPPLSIAPNMVPPQMIADLRLDATRLLAPQFAEVVEKAPQPFVQAIQDLQSSRMVVGQRTIIIGDAAFVARPHVGMGVTKAAADACSLVAALEGHPGNLDAALVKFERERLAYGGAIVKHARRLGAYMQAQLSSDDERATAEKHRRPEAILAETAIAPDAKFTGGHLELSNS